MSHHDKFWEKFGQKIRQHQPAVPVESEWSAMEQLLDKPARPARKINGKLLALILGVAIMGYLAGAWYGFPSTPGILGAFPIPMKGIAQMKKSIPDEPGTARLSFIEDNNTKKHELSSGGIAPRYGTTKNGKPDSADSSVVAPGHLVPAGNRSDLLVIQPSQLLEEKASGEARRSTSGPLDEKNSIGAVTFNGRMQLLSGLPVVASNIVSQQQEVPGKDEFTVLPEKKRRKFYSGFLLGANLPIFSIEGGSYSFHPFGGFFGGLELTPRWAVQAEAHVKYANNLSVAYEQTVQLETNNGYFFDQASSGIIDKSYMALEMPLVAKYKLSPTVSLLAGLRPSLILDSSSSFLGRQEQDALLAAQSSNGQSRSNISGEPALRKFDLGASVGLEWAFYRRWSFDARFSHGLLDLTPNQAFQTNKQHFNTDLQFSIRRKF